MSTIWKNTGVVTVVAGDPRGEPVRATTVEVAISSVSMDGYGDGKLRFGIAKDAFVPAVGDEVVLELRPSNTVRSEDDTPMVGES